MVLDKERPAVHPKQKAFLDNSMARKERRLPSPVATIKLFGKLIVTVASAIKSVVETA
jgi:hypothetical protein